MSAETFGERVRAAREATGLNQAGLARLTGLNSATISRIERGLQDNPTRETVDALARALRVSAQELLPEGMRVEHLPVDRPDPVLLRAGIGSVVEQLDEEIDYLAHLIPHANGVAPEAARAVALPRSKGQEAELWCRGAGRRRASRRT